MQYKMALVSETASVFIAYLYIFIRQQNRSFSSAF